MCRNSIASLLPAILLLLACSLSFGEAPVVSRIVDEEISKALKKKSIEAASQATDAELVRRIYLDVLGRIPTADETTRYLDDSQEDKHHRLIDELLAHEEMPAYWRTVVDEWLNGGLLERDFGRDGFLAYLEQAIKTNKRWNTIAREMLVADLSDEQQRSATYFLATRLRKGDKVEKIDRMASGVATVLFGVQLQCAKCHDHPFVDQWKQDHYYGLAAFLGRTQEARIGNTPVIKERAEGEVKFVTTEQEEKTAKLMFLDGRVFEEPKPPEDRDKWYTKGKNGLPDKPYFSRREVLADYALTADSPLFKRAIVNRMWKQLMGRGLVEPVDQMHEANPATHPELLNRLADDFAKNGFDLRRLTVGILHSDVYLRSTRWTGGEAIPSEQDYATAIMKPLTPDQLAVSIGIATGHYDTMVDKFEREKGKRKPKIDKVTAAIARGLYSRDRDLRDFAARFRTGGDGFEANAGQALFLTYSSLMQKRLQPSNGSLVQLLTKKTNHVAAVRAAFVAVLSRLPTDAEIERSTEFLAGDKATQNKRCSELVWALLCSSEFRFNH
jgi:hypothetical protein